MKKITIPIKELTYTFSKSSGPGGQNINKVNTKVTLNFNIQKTKCISREIINRFCLKYPNKVKEDGTVVITAARYRTQAQNITDSTRKLEEMIESVSVRQKRRISTKPTRSSIQKRLKSKKAHSDKKKFRKKDNY